jgi:hypothetical protein
MAKDILNPVRTDQSSSPSIRRAAREPANWRAQGETDPKTAVTSDPRKNPICPKENK